jgi:predicted branched-subunit amino acid permease
MKRLATRVVILVGLLVLGMFAGVVASSYDFSAAEKAVMAALLVTVAVAGVVMQVNARRQAR